MNSETSNSNKDLALFLFKIIVAVTVTVLLRIFGFGYDLIFRALVIPAIFLVPRPKEGERILGHSGQPSALAVGLSGLAVLSSLVLDKLGYAGSLQILGLSNLNLTNPYWYGLEYLLLYLAVVEAVLPMEGFLTRTPRNKVLTGVASQTILTSLILVEIVGRSLALFVGGLFGRTILSDVVIAGIVIASWLLIQTAVKNQFEAAAKQVLKASPKPPIEKNSLLSVQVVVTAFILLDLAVILSFIPGAIQGDELQEKIVLGTLWFLLSALWLTSCLFTKLDLTRIFDKLLAGLRLIQPILFVILLNRFNGSPVLITYAIILTLLYLTKGVDDLLSEPRKVRRKIYLFLVGLILLTPGFGAFSNPFSYGATSWSEWKVRLTESGHEKVQRELDRYSKNDSDSKDSSSETETDSSSSESETEESSTVTRSSEESLVATNEEEPALDVSERTRLAKDEQERLFGIGGRAPVLDTGNGIRTVRLDNGDIPLNGGFRIHVSQDEAGYIAKFYDDKDESKSFLFALDLNKAKDIETDVYGRRIGSQLHDSDRSYNLLYLSGNNFGDGMPRIVQVDARLTESKSDS